MTGTFTPPPTLIVRPTFLWVTTVAHWGIGLGVPYCSDSNAGREIGANPADPLKPVTEDSRWLTPLLQRFQELNEIRLLLRRKIQSELLVVVVDNVE